MLNSFRIISTVIVPFLLSFASIADNDKESKKAEMSLKFNVGSNSSLDFKEWRPNFGGIIAFDYNLFRYFSLGAEAGIKSIAFRANPPGPDKIWIGRTLDVLLGIVPKLLVPIEFQSGSLIPYLGMPIGGILLSKTFFTYPPDKHGSSSGLFYFGLVLGAKYFFTPNFGISLDYNFSVEIRNRLPVVTGTILGGNLGIIYAF